MQEGILPNIVLVGPRGVGISTVGRLIARRMDWELLDTTAGIASEVDIPHEEPVPSDSRNDYPALERRIIKKAAQRPYSVIAAHSSALLDPANLQALQESGIIILLVCERDVLLSRLQAVDRPGESTPDAPRPLSADLPLQVDTTHLTPEEVAQSVMDLYGPAAQDYMSPCAI